MREVFQHHVSVLSELHKLLKAGYQTGPVGCSLHFTIFSKLLHGGLAGRYDNERLITPSTTCHMLAYASSLLPVRV